MGTEDLISLMSSVSWFSWYKNCWHIAVCAFEELWIWAKICVIEDCDDGSDKLDIVGDWMDDYK